MGYCHVYLFQNIYKIRSTHTLTVSLECRPLLIMLVRKGGFWTQTPSSVTGETLIAIQVKPYCKFTAIVVTMNAHSKFIKYVELHGLSLLKISLYGWIFQGFKLLWFVKLRQRHDYLFMP